MIKRNLNVFYKNNGKEITVTKSVRKKYDTLLFWKLLCNNSSFYQMKRSVFTRVLYVDKDRKKWNTKKRSLYKDKNRKIKLQRDSDKCEGWEWQNFSQMLFVDLWKEKPNFLSLTFLEQSIAPMIKTR